MTDLPKRPSPATIVNRAVRAFGVFSLPSLSAAGLAAPALLGMLLVGPAPAQAQEVEAAEAGEASAPQTKKRRGKRRGKKRGKRRAADTADSADAVEAQEGETGAVSATTAAPAGSLRRSNKMEFDARLVRGETAGTGAVVLFDRGQRELPALTAERTGFLNATIQEVYVDQRPKATGNKRGRASRGNVGMAGRTSAAKAVKRLKSGKGSKGSKGSKSRASVDRAVEPVEVAAAAEAAPDAAEKD